MDRRIYIIIIIFILSKIYADETQILEFNNKPIVDVLMVLADLNGKKIIIDKTVQGNCSYYFSTDNLDEALELFLKSQNLYITKKDKAFEVSKIYTQIENINEISVETTDTDIKIILDRLTSITGKTILYDNLPRTLITLNINKLPLNVILEIVMKKYSDYTVEESDEYFYIKKIVTNSTSNKNDTNSKTNGITLSVDGYYSVNLNKVRFTQVINELFSKELKEYSIQGRNDNIIERLEFNDKTFDQMLNLIIEAGSCDYVISNDIYYIFDINKTEIANNHIITKVIKLEYLTVKELLQIIPGSFMSNNALKVDEVSNSVIVYGTEIKISPIVKFIELVDKDKELKPRWIYMNFVPADLLKNILLKTYTQSSFINVDKDSFIIMLTDDEYEDVLISKKELDIPPNSHKITLKYIKSEELLLNLPKTVTIDQLVVTANPSVLFYYGENEGYSEFLKELNQIDKPVPQIKYKILVLQNTLGDNKEFDISYSGHSEDNGDITLPEDNWNAFSGVLGSLLGLNFNVISAFGPLFSIELNAKINDNKSKILVDTTLQGLSGKKISFRNTTTSRFYQSSTNADGETEQTGATQEVSWGIILDIEGWTSGDGMVTVNIQSTLSDETKVSGDSSGIPSTSEKIVNTEVRTPEGVPVVIGGLLSSKIETSEEKTPLLGDIPLLGFLFRKTVERETQSEFEIYLIPYIEDFSEDNINLKLERAYKDYINR